MKVLGLDLQIFLIILVAIYALVILSLLKKQKMDIKYSLIWLLSAVVLIIFVIFPQIVAAAASAIGIDAPVNLIYIVAGLFMIMIIMSLTVIVSGLKNKIKILSQKQGLIEKRLRELENKVNGREDIK